MEAVAAFMGAGNEVSQHSQMFLWLTIMIIHGVAGEGITLSSSVPAETLLCPNQEVIFTCETTGSPTITWSSTEYIDEGSRLEFATFNLPGTNRTSPINPKTVATLISVSIVGGLDVLVSQLRITTLENFLTFSISCLLINSTEKTVRLQLLGDAGIPQDFTSNLRKDNKTGRCEIQSGWSPPTNISQNDISHYRVVINGENVINETNINHQSLIISSYPVCNCTENEVSVSAVDRCDRQGQSTPAITLDQEPIPLPTSVCEDMASTQPNDNNNPGANRFRDATIALGLLFGITFLVLAVVITVTVAVVIYLLWASSTVPVWQNENI